MPISVLYFAWVRDKVSLAHEQIESLPTDINTPGDLTDWLARRGGGYAEAFLDVSRLRCAVDQKMVAMDSRFDNPQEIAFFPPVTGG
jgi:sulfur-carrier protein